MYSYMRIVFFSHSVRIRDVFERWTAAYNEAIVARLRTTQADIHYRNSLSRRSLAAWILFFRMQITKRVISFPDFCVQYSYSLSIGPVHISHLLCCAQRIAEHANQIAQTSLLGAIWSQWRAQYTSRLFKHHQHIHALSHWALHLEQRVLTSDFLAIAVGISASLV